jgi:hypothetical protein
MSAPIQPGTRRELFLDEDLIARYHRGEACPAP